MLEVNNFTNQILHDISFKLDIDENLIVLGKNGAGKSTLAKVLCNLISNENVKLFDQSIQSLSENQRTKFINYIPPKLEIFDEYITTKEYLEMSSISDIKKDRINEIIALLKLENVKDRYCINLSSGEQQLLLLASAFIHNAEITIFDELTANLDISRVKEVFDIFKSVSLKQKIIITHNLDLAYNLKYKVLFLEDGKVEFFGSSNEFFELENLNKFYNNSIKIVDNHLVVNL
ncbi:ABC transporter ATP-binding protein [Arcobacter sp. LA11]|uniref:ATP-binding cassette domain-containing protein n=1 Tax=Arcobacter sp. LA11 TaxID=1898176 RepID=UPI000932AF4A|nr:ABC transporter ATP-binding protein [Arcobacter sp. LA11]